MSFDSLGYYILLSATLLLYLCTKHRGALLLLISFLFYAFFSVKFLALLLGLALLNHFAALLLAQEKYRKPWLLSLVVIINLSPLVLLKTMEAFHGSIVLPLGLSFYTFHCISYVVDVYRRVAPAEPLWQNTLLYISFFPQLVAGPITRATQMLPQLRALTLAEPSQVESGLGRIYLGLFKKFVIANVCAGFVASVFSTPSAFASAVVLLAILAGRYFIYADLSAYTDIAIGSARLFGLELPENFRRPFAAQSIGDYWRRWHISLSTWIRDYVYYPLLSTPLARFGVYPVLIATFLTLGLWHGFSPNFFFYGLWHGCMLVAQDLTRHTVGKCARLCPEGFWRNLGFSLVTYVVFVCPPTVLFLTHSLSEAKQVFSQLAAFLPGKDFVISAQMQIAIYAILALELFQWKQEVCVAWLARQTTIVKILLLILASVSLLLLGEFSLAPGFVYFKF